MIRLLKTREEREEFKRISMYCFGDQRYEKLDKKLHYPMDWFLGVFDENCSEEDVKEGEKKKSGIIMSGMVMIPFIVNLRKARFNCIGLQDVVSRPQYRNRGYVRNLLLEGFRRMNEQGIAISNLMPFKFSYYEKYGYALADEIVQFHFNPSNLDKVNTFPVSNNLEIREIIDPEYCEDFKKVRRFVTHNRLDYCIRERQPIFWSKLYPEKTFKFICYDKKSREPMGYIIWYVECGKLSLYYSYYSGVRDDTFSKTRDVMVIREMHWKTKEAKFELFRFIWSHRDQVALTTINLPGGESRGITELFSDLKYVKKTIRYNSMLRVVNLEKVLESLPFEEDLEVEEFRVFVKDKDCEWNHGIWRFGKKKKEKLVVEKEGLDNGLFDIDFDIKHLGMLVSGVRSMEELVESVHFSVCRRGAVKSLALLFPPCRFNFVNDTF